MNDSAVISVQRYKLFLLYNALAQNTVLHTYLSLLTHALIQVSLTIPDSVIDRNWFGKKDAQLIKQAMQINSKQMMKRMSSLTDGNGIK